MTPKYRAGPKDDLIWHGLDSMTLLFHRPSGITHMLADPAPALLEVMDSALLTAAEIITRLKARFDVESGADTNDIISARLEELAALRARMESIESEFNSFEELQKLDWDSELQTNADDFADRATVATERVFHARQRLLQEVFAQ